MGSKRIFWSLLLVAICIWTIHYPACASTLNLTKSSQVLVAGSRSSYKVNGIKSRSIKWQSSNRKVATVTKAGVVRAIKAGTATIIGRYKKIKFSCKVRVVSKAKKTVLCNNSRVKVVLLQITPDKMVIRVKNKTNKDFDLLLDYIILGKQYKPSYTSYLFPAKFERSQEYTIEAFEDSNNKFDISGNKISGRISIYRNDGNMISYKFLNKKFR